MSSSANNKSTGKENSLSLRSPAKLNLFLHITGQRKDGYHTLQTIFQLIDWCDEMHFSVSPSSARIEVSPSIDGIAPEDNLIFKAANLLRHSAQRPELGAHIKLDKHIPMGAGLGGGSSNAASTLLALNHLWQTGFSPAELAKMGLSLGADVPIFIYGKSAWAEGVGEHILPVSIEPKTYLVIAPNCHVATAAVFNDQQLTRDTPAIKLADFMQSSTSPSHSIDWSFLEKSWHSGLLHNDCETVVRKQYPAVNAALNWLKQFGNSQMTGTGSCVFLVLDDTEEDMSKALQIIDQLPPMWQGFAAKSTELVL